MDAFLFPDAVLYYIQHSSFKIDLLFYYTSISLVVNQNQEIFILIPQSF